MPQAAPHGGKLYIVATPIGHLDDMTLRGIQTLKNADLIAAEDTRHSAKLLTHFSIDTPLIAYHEHNAGLQLGPILAALQGGRQVALISDAGTPLISDPGYRLVRACHEAGVAVSPVPGASALLAAVSAAGLPSDRYYFEGFLPARAEQRRKRLAAIARRTETLVLYESCHRIVDSLADMVGQLGAGRRVAFCREMTKSWETIRLLGLEQLHSWVAADANQRRGEIVLVVEGAPALRGGLDAATRRWLLALAAELPPARAAAVGAKVTGMKKREIYAWLSAAEDGGGAD